MKKKLIWAGVVLAAALLCGGVLLLAAPQSPQQPRASVPQTGRPVSARSSTTPAASITPVAGTPTATPATIVVSTPTTVTVTTSITPSPILNGVNLPRLGATGTQSTIHGVMHDDGKNGDAVAGDGLYTLQVRFNEPTAGLLQLQVSAAFGGLLKRVTSALTTIQIWSSFVDASSNTRLLLPPLGTPTTVVTDSVAPARTLLSVQRQTETVLGITIYRVSPGTTLQAWFTTNVDVNNILLNTTTFRYITLSDGLPALVLSSPVPSSYLMVGGPVDFIYIMSPGGDRVVSITPGQESQPADFGFDNAQTMINIASAVIFQ